MKLTESERTQIQFEAESEYDRDHPELENITAWKLLKRGLERIKFIKKKIREAKRKKQ